MKLYVKLSNAIDGNFSISHSNDSNSDNDNEKSQWKCWRRYARSSFNSSPRDSRRKQWMWSEKRRKKDRKTIEILLKINKTEIY